jgi:hypothetical protein
MTNLASITIDHVDDQSYTSLEQIAAEIIAAENGHRLNRIEFSLGQGARLSAARHLCESAECGVEGPNPDARFGFWLEENFADTYSNTRTLYNYRALFENFGHLSPDTIRLIGVSNCYRLANTTDEVKRLVIDRAEAGEKLSGETVDEIIGETIRAEAGTEEPKVRKQRAIKEPKASRPSAANDDEPQAGTDTGGVSLQRQVLEAIALAPVEGVSLDALMSLPATPHQITAAVGALLINAQIVTVSAGVFAMPQGQGFMTQTQYKKLLKWLHPDKTGSDETADLLQIIGENKASMVKLTRKGAR